MTLQEILNKLKAAEKISEGDVQNINEAFTESKAKAVHSANEEAAKYKVEAEANANKIATLKEEAKAFKDVEKQLKEATEKVTTLEYSLKPYKEKELKDSRLKLIGDKVKDAHKDDVIDLLNLKGIFAEDRDEKDIVKDIDEFLKAKPMYAVEGGAPQQPLNTGKKQETPTLKLPEGKSEQDSKIPKFDPALFKGDGFAINK